MLVIEEIDELKFDEISSGIVRFFTARSFMFKNVHSSVARYKVEIVDVCKKLKGSYSIMLAIENQLVTIHDWYGFMLLVMGKKSYDVIVFIFEDGALDLMKKDKMEILLVVL